MAALVAALAASVLALRRP
ncbi:hypothetical protein ACFQH8_17190 [Halomicroarcula sp. GCM10025710]